MSPVSTLGASTLFPIPPNGEFAVTLSREWLTDVQRTRSGAEVRQALRSRPVRTLTYTATVSGVVEVAQFFNLWLSAVEPLRFLVPLWPDATSATAFPDSTTVTADTTDRAFVEGGLALLCLSASLVEVVTIDSVASDAVTLADPVALPWSTYPPGAVQLIPLMGAWLSPPTKDVLTADAEHVPLTFTEELPGVAGIDAASGGPATAEPATITVSRDIDGDSGAGRKFPTFTATAFDAAGFRIPDAAFAWTVVATGDVAMDDPGLSITYPMRGQQIHFTFSGTGDTSFEVTVTAGSATTTFTVSGVA